jgi:hypothetical protein
MNVKFFIVATMLGLVSLTESAYTQVRHNPIVLIPSSPSLGDRGGQDTPRYRYLLDRRTRLNPAETAEFEALQAGRSQPHAFLAGLQATGQLSPAQRAELDVLNAGGTQWQATLAGRRASGEVLTPEQQAQLLPAGNEFCTPDNSHETCSTAAGVVYRRDTSVNQSPRNILRHLNQNGPTPDISPGARRQ